MPDVIVVGGGPAGLASAIEVAQRGMSVSVVERRRGPIDKACGEGLMPGAWQDLQHLGLRIERSHPLRGIRYLRGDALASVDFRDAGRGIRRTVLHQALLDRAQELGVEHVQRTVDKVRQDESHVHAAGLRGRWLIAADGLRSPIRQQLGLTRRSRWPRRYGLRRHFEMAPWSPYVEVYWADDAEAYVTPVDDNLVGVAMLFGDAARRKEGYGPPFERLLRRFPDLEARLGHPASSARGAGPFAWRSSAQVSHRVLLVGDAAGYLDPLTGEGLKLGFRGARAAATAIAENRPRRYEAAWRTEYRRYLLATGGLLLVTRPRWARRLVVPVVRRIPRLMQAVVDLIAA